MTSMDCDLVHVYRYECKVFLGHHSQHVYRECVVFDSQPPIDPVVGPGVAYSCYPPLNPDTHLCFLGAYTINYSVFDVAVAFVFGLFGYLLKKYEFEPAPLVLAFILGPQIEMTFGQSMIVSDGSPMIFISRPISAFFVLLALG